MNNQSFDLELQQATSSNRRQVRERVVGTATGVSAIAIVTCITLLIINAGSPTLNNELGIFNQDNEFFVDSFTLKSVMMLKKNSGIKVESFLDLFSDEFINAHDSKLVERSLLLGVKYTFDVIDSNDNSSVEKAEWEKFFKTVYPQDYDSLFSKWFDEVNGGKAFDLNAYTKWLFTKVEQISSKPPVLKTPPKDSQTNLGKLIVNDASIYKKTYNFVFDLFDINSDKIVTKEEFYKVQLAFGAPPSKATETSNNLFTNAQQYKLSSDGKTIKYDAYVQFCEAIKKPLQDQVNHKALLLQDQNEFVINRFTFKQLMSLQQQSSVKLGSLLDLFSQEFINAHDGKLIERSLLLAVKYTFDIIDSNDNSNVDKTEWANFFKAIYPQDYDSIFSKWFDEVNAGKAFDLNQYGKWLFTKVEQVAKTPLTLKTPEKQSQMHFVKLIVNDANNYKKTYNFVFDLFDINNDKILTKEEFYKVQIAFGSPPTKATEASNNLFTFAQQNKLSSDGKTIKHDAYVQFCEAMRKPLQDLVKQQTLLAHNQVQLKNEFFIDQSMFNQAVKLQKQLGFKFDSFIDLFSDQFISAHDSKLVERTLLLTIKYTFDVIDSNDNNNIDKQEWQGFFKGIYPLDYDAVFSKWFDEVNAGKPIDLNTYTKWLLTKVEQVSSKPIVLKTPQKDIQNNLGKLIVNDEKVYKKTYNFIFDVFDINSDKIISREEFNKVELAFGAPPAKATQDTNSVFNFAQQNKLSSDGKTIKHDVYVQFCDALRKPLQDQLKKQTFLLEKYQQQQQALLSNLEDPMYQVYQTTLNTVFDSLDKAAESGDKFNPEQQKVVDHVVNTILEFEFDFADTNNDNVLSQAEHRAMINSIFHNKEDREHYYKDFDSINGGKDVTHAQFLEHFRKHVTDDEHFDDEYEPKEKGKKIGKRLAKLIIKNDRNYDLTYKFVFDLFDLNGDKVVSVTEIHHMIDVFDLPPAYEEPFDTNTKKAFAELQKAGVGNGEKVTFHEWEEFAKKIRPDLYKIIKKQVFFFVISVKPVFDF